MSLVCDLAPALAVEAGRWCYGTSSATAVVNGPIAHAASRADRSADFLCSFETIH